MRFNQVVGLSSVVVAITALRAAGSNAWDGYGVTGNYSNSFNWENLAVPNSTDTVFFEGASASSTIARSTVVVDVQSILNYMEISDSEPFANWEFDKSGNGSLQINNDLSIYQTGGNSEPNVVFNGVNINASGTASMSFAALTVEGGMSLSAATFNLSSSTLEINGSSQVTGFFGTQYSVVDVNATLNAKGMNVGTATNLNINSGGTLNLMNNGTVTAGTMTLSSGGALSISSGSKLTVNSGGVFALTGFGYQLPNNTTLAVTGAGKVNDVANLDIGFAANGTLLVDGASSAINCQTTQNVYEYWGYSTGGHATVTFSNSGAGTFGYLDMSSATVSVNSGATLTVNGGLIVAGGGTNSSIAINGAELVANKTPDFGSGANVSVSNYGTLLLNDNTTFEPGSTYTGTIMKIGSGKTVTFEGVGTFTGLSTVPDQTYLNSGGTFKIASGGVVTDPNQLFINNPGTGTLIIDGSGSKYTNTGKVAQIAQFNNGAGYLTVSNAGAATFANGLNLSVGSGSTSGGSSTLSLLTNGSLNTTTLLVGSGTGTAQQALLNINGGTLNTTGIASFLGGADVKLTGGLRLGSDATFSTGSSLNWTAGTLTLNSGKTLTFDGGAGTLGAGGGLSNGATLHITNGGKVTANSYYEIGDSSFGGANGTLNIDVSGSSYINSSAATEIGTLPGDFGTLSVSNSGAASFNAGLHLGGLGGKSLVTLSGGSLNVAGLVLENTTVAGGASTINVSGGTMNVNGLQLGVATAGINASTIAVTGSGVFNSTGPAQFNNGATLTVNGTIGNFPKFNATGNTTFSTGSSVSVSGFASFTMGTGMTLAFPGGVGTFGTSSDFNLPSADNLQITNAGKFFGSAEVNIASGAATGTLLVDGANSVLSATTPFYSFWGVNTGNTAVATFSNSATGTFSGLSLASSGGTATLNVLSNAKLTLGGILAGGSTGAATVNVNGGVLAINGASGFGQGATANVSGSGRNLDLYANTTFSAGSTLNFSAGFLNIGPSATLSLNGAVGSFTTSTILQTGGTLLVQNGGHVTALSTFDIGEAANLESGAINFAGNLVVDGGTSSFAGSDLELAFGGIASVTFQNNSVGTFSNGLRTGSLAGGQAFINVNSGATLNIGSGLSLNPYSSGSATVSIGGGTINSTGTSIFGSGALINLSSGGLVLGGNATFNSGATLNWTGGSFNVTSGKNLTVAGGVLNRNAVSGQQLCDAGVLSITSGGQCIGTGNLDIANLNGSGTLLADGTNTLVSAGALCDWGANDNHAATVSFSNAAVANLNSLELGVRNAASTVSFASNSTLNLSGTLLVGGGTTVRTAALTISSASATVTGAATFDNQASVTLSGGTLVVNGGLTMLAGSKVLANPGGRLRATSLTMSGGANLSLVASNSNVLRVGTLTLDSASKIDLADNDMVVDYSGASPLSTVTGYITTGRNGGAWTGNDITSSSAAANPLHNTALAIAEAFALFGPGGGTYSSGGNTISMDGTTLLIKYTYLGDANLDGVVNIADLGILATHYGQSSQTWTGGDFNYDGTINIADLGILATDYGLGSTSPLSMNFQQALAEVEAQTGVQLPEPGSTLLLGVALVASRRRCAR